MYFLVVLIELLLIVLHIAENRLHHVWQAYVATWLNRILRLIALLEDVNGGSWWLDDQVLFIFDALVPCVVKPDFVSVPVPFVIRHVLYSLLRFYNHCEAS